VAVCECLEKCPFFNDHMVDMPATAEITKKRFCRAGWKRAGLEPAPTHGKGRFDYEI
jgi:hypothetical protein